MANDAFRQNTPSAHKNRKLFLDGIRGWAAVMVLLGHAMISMLAMQSYFGNRFVLFVLWFITNAQLAIQIFFVLSGFALSTRYFQTHDIENFGLLVVRRYLRLTIPIILTSFLAYLFLINGWMVSIQTNAFPPDAWIKKFYHFAPSWHSLLTFSLATVYTTSHGSFVATYNPNLWTMPVELCGSIMVFLLLTIVNRFNKRLLIYLALLNVLFFLGNAGLISFLYGIMIADASESPFFAKLHLHPASMAFSVFLLAAGIIMPAYADTAFTLPLAATCIVLGIALNSGISGFFENRFSRFLGKISFSLYLLHLMILGSLSCYIYTWMTGHGYPTDTVRFVTLSVSLAASFAAAVLFAPVEQSSQGWARRISDAGVCTGRGNQR